MAIFNSYVSLPEGRFSREVTPWLVTLAHGKAHFHALFRTGPEHGVSEPFVSLGLTVCSELK
jgi:hypothetical protein